MKWPASIRLVRHGHSAYNALREQKDAHPDFGPFKTFYNRNRPIDLPEQRLLAQKLKKDLGLGVGDYDTPLSDEGRRQSRKTGAALAALGHQPDVVLVSPYVRTRQTWDEMREGGFEASHARIIIEDRIREQEHGLATLYPDWRVFHTFHPEQRELREQMGPYWYQYPQGESVSMVRDRLRDVTTMLIREFAGAHVMMITHHLTILSLRANYERLSPEEFIRLDEEEKPVNCGVTQYVCDMTGTSDGRLKLVEYNKKHY